MEVVQEHNWLAALEGYSWGSRFRQKVRRGESKCWDGKIDEWMDGLGRERKKKKGC